MMPNYVYHKEYIFVGSMAIREREREREYSWPVREYFSASVSYYFIKRCSQNMLAVYNNMLFNSNWFGVSHIY